MSDKTEEALIRYIAQTSEIRDLSSPQVDDIRGAEEYRAMLLRNFRRIGTLALSNNRILASDWFPLMESEDKLSDDAVHALQTFAQALLDAYRMENLDLPMRYRQTDRLLRDADEKGDVDAIIRALDAKVEIAFAMMHMTQRLSPVDDTAYRYRDDGFTAAHRLLSYLPHEQFASLPSEALKHIVLVNARYVSALFDRSDDYGDYYNDNDFELMRRALALCEDDFYREQAPTYNWRYHEFRTLQYITNFTELNNVRKMRPDQLKEIASCTKRMDELWRTDPDYFGRYCPRESMDLYLSRVAFLTGELDQESYKHRLDKLIRSGNMEHFSLHDITIHLMSFAEYLFVIGKEKPTGEDAKNFARYYESMVRYVHNMPKKGSLSFLLSFMSNILKIFIPVEEGIDFETFGLRLMAALHPPTYVHSLSVASFTACLTAHMVKQNPALFIGLLECKSEQDVRGKKDRIVDFAYHGALCHDFGKLFVTEVIMTYGRDLFDEEFELIKQHPVIGSHILSRYETTRAYANIAKLHHLWYDQSAGYPADTDKDALPEHIVIDIVACADCLDAATDAIGRSYKKGKTLDEFIEELRDGRGTRYAPEVVDLFSHEEVRAEIEEILTKGRDDHYREAYEMLSVYRTRQ